VVLVVNAMLGVAAGLGLPAGQSLNLHRMKQQQMSVRWRIYD